MPTPFRLSLLLAPAIALIWILNPAALLAKPAWRTATTDNLIIFSNESPKTTKRVVEELLDARKTLKALFPGLALESKIPLRVVVCRDQKTVKTFSPLYDGKAKEVGGVFYHGFEGPTIVVHAGPEWEYTRHTVYHEYVHYLTVNGRTYLPPWLSEGLAELLSTIRTRKDGQVEVGQVIPYSIAIFRSQTPIPLKRFFLIHHDSPEYNSENHGQGIFYAQSWLFLHFLKYGDHDLPENAFNTLANRVLAGEIVTEKLIQEVLGVDYATLESQLETYSKKGTFTRYRYTLEKESKELDLNLRNTSDGEYELLLGSLLLSSRSPREAYSHLAKAIQLLPDEPLAHAYLGYHASQQEQWEDAVESLNQAIELGSNSPYTLLNYVSSWLDLHQAAGSIIPGSISRDETLALLTCLFKSREIADGFDPRLYHSIGRIWLASAVEPTDAHMQVLKEGLNLFPDDEHIAYYLALYFEKTERYNQARTLVNRFYPGNLSGSPKYAYRLLDERLRNREQFESVN